MIANRAGAVHVHNRSHKLMQYLPSLPADYHSNSSRRLQKVSSNRGSDDTNQLAERRVQT